MLEKYLYTWPHAELDKAKWEKSVHAGFIEHSMPESEEKLAMDSRWPGFFPSAICFVTAGDDTNNALEKVVGATIVNRFPYIVAFELLYKAAFRASLCA